MNFINFIISMNFRHPVSLHSFVVNREISGTQQAKTEKGNKLNAWGESTVAGCQVPTKATLSLPSSDGQRRENNEKLLG